MNASIDFISTTIGDIADVISGPFGSQLHESDYKEHGTPIVTVEHLSPYGLTTQNLPFVGDEDKERLNRYTLKQGDIVFSRVGSVDRCSLVREKEEGWLFSGRLLRIRLNNSEKEMATLLSYIFQTNRFTHQVRSKAVGQTMPSLNNGIVKSLQISIPRNPKLQKIYCDTLINIDQKINLLTKKKEALETYKKGLMQKIFSQELRFKREDGTDYPEWRRVKLGDIQEFKNGKPTEPYWCENGKYEVITLNSVSINGKLKASGRKTDFNDNSLEKGDLVMVLSDIAHANLLGLCDVIPSEGFILNQRMGRLRVAAEVDPYFLRYAINRQQKYFKRKGQGTSQKHIYQRDVDSLTIELPCFDEQMKITETLKSIDLMTSRIIDANSQTSEMKKGLLQQMFV